MAKKTTVTAKKRHPPTMFREMDEHFVKLENSRRKRENKKRASRILPPKRQDLKHIFSSGRSERLKIVLEEYPGQKYDAFICKCIPVHLFFRLIEACKRISKKDFDSYSNQINGGNRGNEGSTQYLMYHWTRKSGVKPSMNEEGHNWLANQLLTEDDVAAIASFLKLVKDEYGRVTGRKMEGWMSHPGILKTVQSAHQTLHRDTRSPDTNAFILHMPLDIEGLALRLGNSTISSNSAKYIHVPLGSFLILGVHQYHAGHYGSVGSRRFHAVFQKGGFDDSRLGILESDNSELVEDNPAEMIRKLCKNNGGDIITGSRVKLYQALRPDPRMTELLEKRLI